MSIGRDRVPLTQQRARKQFACDHMRPVGKCDICSLRMNNEVSRSHVSISPEMQEARDAMDAWIEESRKENT